jgi:hypothetical protein
MEPKVAAKNHHRPRKFVAQPNKNHYVNLALRCESAGRPIRQTNVRFSRPACLVRRHQHFQLTNQHLELHAANAASSIRTAELPRTRGEEATHYADEASAFASLPLPLPLCGLPDARLVRAVPFRRLAIKNDDGVSLRTNASYAVCEYSDVFEQQSYASASAFPLGVDDPYRTFDAQESPRRRENTHERRFPERQRRADTHVQLRER